jgi:hypothetical protein
VAADTESQSPASDTFPGYSIFTESHPRQTPFQKPENRHAENPMRPKPPLWYPTRSRRAASSKYRRKELKNLPHSLKNGKKFRKHDALYGEWVDGGSTICAARYVRCVGNSEEILNFLCRGVYKVWRAGYHSVCRLVRYQIDTIKDPGVLLLLSLSPPITPKVRSGISSLFSSQLLAISRQLLSAWRVFPLTSLRFRSPSKKVRVSP